MSRLSDYIDSNLTKLPEDYRNYVTSRSCLFCDDTHDSYPIATFNGGQHHEDSGAHACHECFLEIEDARTSILDIIPPATTHLKRIRKYVYEGAFDFDVDLYYAHDGDNLMKDHCYFCNKDLIITEGDTIEVPMDITTEFSGGRVRRCGNCKRTCDSQTGNGSMFVVNSWLKTKCVSCRRDYAITPSEHKNRQNEGTEGKHLCPSCVYQNPSPLPSLDNYKSRYAELVCSQLDCEDTILVDRTLSKQAIKELYFPPSTSGNVYCEKCNIGQKPVALFRFPKIQKLVARFFMIGKEEYKVTVWHKQSLAFSKTYQGELQNVTLDLLHDLEEKSYSI